MKILLVDDHDLFLGALRALLTASGIEVVGEANDGSEALVKTRLLRPDVVLMDICMPRCSGIEGVRLIKAEFPDIKVVMLTMSVDDSDLFEALKCGASGYILKNTKPREFLELLSGVVAGEAAISREIATRIMQEFTRPVRPSAKDGTESTASGDRALRSLSERQLDVLKRVTRGETYKEISDALHISIRTVNYHMTEILDKLQLQNRVQVIAYAMRMGLLDDSALSNARRGFDSLE
jgi:DNA-binding NarL/FixJ family response regulator